MAYSKNEILKVVSFVIIALILASCGAGRSSVSNSKTSKTLQDDIIQYGSQFLGKPYRYAGKGPGSFDCSGYTSFVFRKFGYRLSSSSSGQDKQVPSIENRKELRKGDLVFFEGNRKNGNVGHVGIVTQVSSNGHFKFIHSSTTSGVIISSSKEPYYATRYLRGGRVLEENASYVTRSNRSAVKNQSVTYSTTANKNPNQPKIPKVSPGESTHSSVITENVEIYSDKKNEPVVLVQTDPKKNNFLTPQNSNTNEKEQEKGAGKFTKNDSALREENLAIPSPPKSHVVQAGETLYSISKYYGCSVEQLKKWNPQLGEMLKTGDNLHIFR